MDGVFLSILRGGIESGASDIHIKPGAPIIFRIDRQLVSAEAPLHDSAWMERVLGEIVPPRLQMKLEQEHEVDFALAIPALGRFRVNVFQQRGELTLALRIVKTSVRGFAELNLPDIAGRIAEAARGIIIIAGAIGSGKSTTLAAMLDHINTTSRKHIITLEDPIEFLLTDKQSVIEQREIGLDTATYTTGLRHVLRQDPDVLVIGEMRDAESAVAAMSAANIGHLVITTLHTSDATKSVQRILEFFPAAERDYARKLFADTLHGVVCQRLVRSTKGAVLPALEILLNNSAVSSLIASDRLDKIPGAMELGSGDGMQNFDGALQKMVTAGQITREEALAHAANPEGLQMAFKGVVLSESRRILGSR